MDTQTAVTMASAATSPMSQSQGRRVTGRSIHDLTRAGRVCSTLERSMERQGERDLEILTAIEAGEPLTQRALAQRLGVALGLANLYLKRLARKGYIKIVEF